MKTCVAVIDSGGGKSVPLKKCLNTFATDDEFCSS